MQHWPRMYHMLNRNYQVEQAVKLRRFLSFSSILPMMGGWGTSRQGCDRLPTPLTVHNSLMPPSRHVIHGVPGF